MGPGPAGCSILGMRGSVLTHTQRVVEKASLSPLLSILLQETPNRNLASSANAENNTATGTAASQPFSPKQPQVAAKKEFQGRLTGQYGAARVILCRFDRVQVTPAGR